MLVISKLIQTNRIGFQFSFLQRNVSIMNMFLETRLVNHKEAFFEIAQWPNKVLFFHS